MDGLDSTKLLWYIIETWGMWGIVVIYFGFLLYKWLKGKGHLGNNKNSINDKLIIELNNNKTAIITSILENHQKEMEALNFYTTGFERFRHLFEVGHLIDANIHSVKGFAYGLSDNLVRLFMKSLNNAYKNKDRYNGHRDSIKQQVAEDFERSINEVDDRLSSVANVGQHMMNKERKLKIMCEHIPTFFDFMDKEKDEEVFKEIISKQVSNIIKNEEF